MRNGSADQRRANRTTSPKYECVSTATAVERDRLALHDMQPDELIEEHDDFRVRKLVGRSVGRVIR